MQTDESQLLQNAFQEFVRASDSLSNHYVVLEDRINQLNRELSQKNRELEKSRESFHNILDSLPVGVIVHDGRSIEFTNKEAKEFRLDGLSTRINSDSVKSGEVRNEKGVFKWKKSILTDGSESKEVVVFEDVTEVQKMKERSERDERLRAMGEMAARIAHEIKNPLGSMKLYLSMVLRGKAGDKEKNHVNSVVFGINTIDRIINNLLSYTRPKTIVPREASLAQVVKETLDFMSVSISSRDISIEFSSSYDGMSWFDPDLIRLPLMNFISNGIEAIESKGIISVAIREEGRYVVAVFADSGAGMSEETRRNIFNPFFTTKDKGVGLGLFIAHNVIKAHDGYIEVESAEGKGSSFAVYLPRKEGEEDFNMRNILVIDDDYHMRTALTEVLAGAGFGVCSAEDGKVAMESIKKASYDLVITDVKMPYINGIDLLGRIKKEHYSLPVIVMTAYGTVEHAVTAIKEGAFDYIQKPFDADALYDVVQRALGVDSGKIVCSSRSMKNVLTKAQQVAKSDATVLVMGESGVGKELISRYIHENGDRPDMPFVAVNCAALPENLLESELFGYEKGAFTGAAFRKPGKFELADKGTILLDEVTEMDLKLQAKLLRVLQEREVEVIGSKYPTKVDVKVIATTNRNIDRYVEEGKFREDLYYRLNVFPIVVPPLRERREDIPQLVAYLLKKYSRGMDMRIDQEAMTYLIQRNWKGNVRELENSIARACILSDYTVIKLTHLEEPVTGRDSGVDAISREAVGSVREMEMRLILDALKSMNGNRTRAASVLGITSRTLRNKIKEYRDMGYAVP